ncbi:MAG TPA: class I SAM-dependent methyltransferase [Steroidobacteraceae bacterium]|nr:class I SAM-dependent methyltransferase [Steroidobacteraceae bacterium]
MHTTAMENGKRFFDAYVASMSSATVVDIGSQDVNGSLKSVCPSTAKYVGVDFIAAKGVDVVLNDPYKLPFETNSIDAVVSSSCFEHSEMFWILYLEILRILKPAGLFYLNSPSNGAFHRYPVDCWRFYPDSGNALARWSRINGMNSAVLESYISHAVNEEWNDYVCVFIKDQKHSNLYPKRILRSFTAFTNGVIYPECNRFLNHADRPPPPPRPPSRWRKKMQHHLQKLPWFRPALR